MTIDANTDANKALVRRVIDEVFLGGNDDAVDELLADDFQAHTWGPMEPGRDGIRAAIKRVAAGLSGATMVVEDLIAEADRVAVRLMASATQTGPFMGMPPSGKRYEIGEIHIFRIRGGQVAEHWHEADLLGMMRQLGAMPSPSGAA
ncbi:MAG: ester cyclase [Candidatus Limnocylindrales bacterium]